MPWFEISVEASPEAVDWVTMAVAASGFVGERVRVERLAAPEGDTAWEYTIRLHVAPDESVDAAAEKVERALQSLRRAGLVSDVYVEQIAPPTSTHTPPERIGDHFVLLEPDQMAELAPDDHVLRLAPNHAFGTGLHPTTRLVLRLLERHVRAGQHALDLGSGSGILSVALARLGARVLALDNDAHAVDATRATVALNGLEAAVTVAAGSLGAGATLGHWMGDDDAIGVEAVGAERRFGVLVANVFARIHMALADDYHRTVEPDGLLILSGFTAEYAATIEERLGETGFAPLERLEDGEWSALVLRRVA